MTSKTETVVPVYIQTDDTGQLATPPSTDVTQHVAVNFIVENPVRVVVTFTGASCLTQPGPFHLDGGDPSKSSTGPIPVRPDAKKDPYPYTVAPETSPGSGTYRKPGDHETKTGTLEVTTDPDY